MSNEPADYNKGCENTQSPYYEEEPGQCDVCRAYVPQDTLSFISDRLHGCTDCYTRSLQEPTKEMKNNEQ